ncbi:MAG: helix-turn-helix transcriptional regulator [Actinoplanes sp.]
MPGSIFVQMPEVATSLVFRTSAERGSDLIVVGPRTRGTYHPGPALTACVRVRLRPGQARAILGVPPDRLVNRAMGLTDLWGTPAQALEDQLASSDGDPELIGARLTAALNRRVAPSRPGTVELVAAAVERLTGAARLGDVAERVGLSERRLRTLFAREVGLSPKHVARIRRLRTVLALAGRQEWAAVAEDAGFFDQAHMISDFRALMGVSPAAYVQGRRPAVTPCTQLSDPRSLA